VIRGVDADLLRAHRFDEAAFRAVQQAVRSGALTPASSVYRGRIEPPLPGDVEPMPTDPALVAEGEAALRAGEVAVVVLAGGMATRFATAAGPTVKGVVDVAGRSFVQRKHDDARRWGAPFAVMASFATHDALAEHLADRPDVLVFDQSIALRLTPDGELLGTSADVYTTPGHGDFFAAIRDSGTLAALRARGVRTLVFSNVDNLGATLNPALIGLFGRLRRDRGIAMLAETVERAPEDGAKVGLVVRADGRLRILEGLRIPEELDQAALVEASINTFTFDAASLDRPIPLDVHVVIKQVGGRSALQAERITCEATGALEDGEPILPFAAVRVPREGRPGAFSEGRFYPVKTHDDLDRVRDLVAASDPAVPVRDRVEAAFRQAFGEPGAWWITAPGRINLVGEHTDYNDGLVLPAAVDRAIVALAAPGGEGITAISLDEGRLDLAPGERPTQGWGRYVGAIAAAFRERDLPVPGVRLVLASELPPGSGMSSSSALCLAIGGALSAIGGLALPPAELARLAQRAEHLVGVACGIMDQWSIAHGRRGHAMKLDCRSMATEHVPVVLGELVLVVGDTRKSRGLVESAYNLRRTQCEDAARRVASASGRRVASLRDVRLEDLSVLPEPYRARALHVLTENQRVLDAVTALGTGDLPAFGRLLRASHASLRDRFEVSCLELDALVGAVEQAGGDAVLGARMMGGGFGGCTLSLIRRDALDRLEEAKRRYREVTGLDAVFYPVIIEDGLRVEPV
jgi:galactokinase